MRWKDIDLKVTSTQMAIEGMRVGELPIILKNPNIYSGVVWMDNKTRKVGSHPENCLMVAREKGAFKSL